MLDIWMGPLLLLSSVTVKTQRRRVIIQQWILHDSPNPDQQMIGLMPSQLSLTQSFYKTISQQLNFILVGVFWQDNLVNFK